MGLRCGIIGLPNVGKSTLFNALTKTASAQAENYPFCTIEPNVGEVSVPDSRQLKISQITGSKKIIETRISFVDIAGLVKGASKGEGLGNQFLANIREVDAIVHVLRCFENSNVAHVADKIDPISDAEIVETELMLADLESLERRIPALQKKIMLKDKEALLLHSLMNKAIAFLQDGKPVREMLSSISVEEKNCLRSMNLLTTKPILYVCNISEHDNALENRFCSQIAKMAEKKKAEHVWISAAIESEIAQFSKEEADEYLISIGVEEPGLNRLIRAAYKLLNLVTYFTAGPKETRAWTVPQKTKAPEAAGVIHSDFERGFIRAQTISYADYVQFCGEQGAKEAGKARDEGKEYEVQDGDIIYFKHNV